jgi:hypothetical protein
MRARWPKPTQPPNCEIFNFSSTRFPSRGENPPAEGRHCIHANNSSERSAGFSVIKKRGFFSHSLTRSFLGRWFASNFNDDLEPGRVGIAFKKSIRAADCFVSESPGRLIRSRGPGSAQEHVFSQNVQVILEVNLLTEMDVPAECVSQSIFRFFYLDTK